MTSSTSSDESNPLLQSAGLPRFDRIHASHVEPAVRELLSRAETLLAEIERTAEPSWESLFERLEAVDLLFEQTWEPVSHLLSVKNSPELRAAHETVLADVVAFGLRSSQSEPIYRAMKSLRDSAAWDSLDPVQQRILDKRLLSAELSGIGLQGPQRERFNEIAKELSQLGTDFSNHVLDSTKAFSLVLTDSAQVEGLPASLKNLTSQSYNRSKAESDPASTPDAGPWKITLDMPCYVPMLEHCRDRQVRETLYRAYVTRASADDVDNTPLIDRILRLRREKAALLGYPSYAELSLASKMAASVDEVESMLHKLRVASWEPARYDLSELVELAQRRGTTDPLEHWDVAFWAERLREERFQYTDEELRPYFSLPRVLDGLYALISRLFDVTIRPADGQASVWEEDVRYYEVLDAHGVPIAAFYLDPYSRPENKRPGAWMNECLNRRFRGGRNQLPVAYLVCNGTPPVGDRPSLMTFSEVVTLFHEFGHGLHHLLTRVDEPEAAGINGVEWDAVELPSQFMENWCYHKPTLMGMTRHVDTGEPLPDELFDKISRARTFRAASAMLRQLHFGLTDLELHHRYDPDSSETAFDVMNRIGRETSVMPPLPENRFLCAFSHIFAGGYAAGYYSYKWAEVLSADAFSAFEDAGLDNESAVVATGRRFRDEVLAVGGGRHPMDSFRAFRGREPSVEPLLRHNALK